MTSNFDRVSQLWPLLIHAAEQRQILFSADVGRYLGLPAVGALSQLLAPVRRYCTEHELPPLTVLVVEQHSGLPADGSTRASDTPAAQVRVFRYNWRSTPAPTLQELHEAAHLEHMTGA
jgi:hypothetical protein